MAWSKAKTAIVTSLVVLLAAGTATVAVKTVNAARSKAALFGMQGNWEGTLATNQVRLRLVLKILKTNGTYRAMLDSVDQGARDIPAAKLSARPHFLHAELPAINADYEANLNADGTEMSGTWKQSKQSLPLTLKRTTEASQVAEALPADDYAPRADSALQGAWEGALKVGNAELRLALRIAEPSEGTFHAQLDSVDQGARNIPVDSLTYHKPAVQFEIKAVGGVFEGNLSDQRDQLAGNWTQMGQKYPLTFKRVDLSAQLAADSEKDYGQGAGDQVQGHWKGTLDVNKVQMRLLFHIARLPDGSYSATLDSPDQGAAGIPASEVKFTAPNLHMDWAAIGGFFTGKLENGKLSGAWHQGGATLPLKLERGAAE